MQATPTGTTMSRRPALTAALALLVLGSGCTSFEMTRLRNGIDREVPEAQVGEGFALSFGFLTMGTARTALALSDDGDPGTVAARAILRNVKKVQIGRYDVEGRPVLSGLATPPVFDEYERKGWTRIVTVREEDEVVWVMAKEKRDDLRDLIVVTLSHEELVVAKLSGNLTRAVAEALHETGWASDLAASLRGAPAADSLATAPTPSPDAADS